MGVIMGIKPLTVYMLWKKLTPCQIESLYLKIVSYFLFNKVQLMNKTPVGCCMSVTMLLNMHEIYP